MLRLFAACCVAMAGTMPAHAYDCLSPTAVELEEVVIESASEGDRVVVEIEALNTFDTSVSALQRYPSRGTMDVLGSGGRLRLGTPFKAYDRFGSKVIVNIVTVPGYADSQAMAAAETAIDVLIGAASDYAFRDSPVLSALSSSVLNELSQQAIEALRGSRVMTSGPTEIGVIAAMEMVPATGFHVTARRLCE